MLVKVQHQLEKQRNSILSSLHYMLKQTIQTDSVLA